MEKYARHSIGVMTVRRFRLWVLRAFGIFEKPVTEYPLLSVVVTIATAGIPLLIVLFLAIAMLMVVLLEGAVFQITKEIRRLRRLEIEEWEDDWFVWRC